MILKEAAFLPILPFFACIVLTALLSDVIALDMSATLASYSAFALEHLVTVAVKSFAICSWFFWRFPTSISLAFCDAPVSPISPERMSTLSSPFTIAFDFTFVFSLQKHANFAYVAASVLASFSMDVFKSVTSLITLAMGLAPAVAMQDSVAHASRERPISPELR